MITNWLFPSTIANLMGSAILASTYFFLFRSDKKAYLGIWASAWCLYAVRYVLLLLFLSLNNSSFKDFILIANQIVALGSGMLLLWGTHVFLDRRFSRRWICLSLAICLYILFTGMCSFSLFWLSLPTFFFLGWVYIWTGIIFMRQKQTAQNSTRIVGITFILWGIHKADYPFLRPIEWIAPWGYLIGATLEIVIAIGMLMVYFQRAQQPIMESERQYRQLFTSIWDAILVTDTQRRIIRCNPAFTELFGFAEAEIRGKLTRCIYENENQFFEIDRQLKNHMGDPRFLYRANYKKSSGEVFAGETKIFPITAAGGEPTGFMSLIRDITERKRFEARLQQTRKLEAIGSLAGGIAHDFNNVLYPLLGFAELLKEDIPADSPLQNHVDEIIRAALRSKDLVKQILTFSRQGDQNAKPVKLAPIVQEAIKLLRSSIPTTIDIQMDIDADGGVVVAEPTQVHQIVMNLAINAYHAMEEKGGRLGVSLKQIRLEADSPLFPASASPELAPGEYALLTVSDTGTGIEKEVLGKIFDPYFTTKQIGRGTGLGLSVVHGIVKKHGGDIRVDSEVGKGSTFRVYLPVFDPGVESESPLKVVAAEAGCERILLVDDEELIVGIEKPMLERLGYQVEAHTGSREALAVFRANPDAFDLLITDMTMPHMTGLQLAREAISIRPGMPVIICSGFSDDIGEQNAGALGIKGFLFKPIAKSEMAQLVRKVLDAEKMQAVKTGDASRGADPSL